MRYHNAKTGALFAGATMLGATAAGHQGSAWKVLGERLGSAFQVADDIRDVAGTSSEIGKPAGQDALLHRPNLALELGVSGALQALDSMIEDAVSVVPDCLGQSELQTQIRITARGFLPESLARCAA
jgi:geranylgeranyl diphosphate synthase type II